MISRREITGEYDKFYTFNCLRGYQSNYTLLHFHHRVPVSPHYLKHISFYFSNSGRCEEVYFYDLNCIFLMTYHVEHLFIHLLIIKKCLWWDFFISFSFFYFNDFYFFPLYLEPNIQHKWIFPQKINSRTWRTVVVAKWGGSGMDWEFGLIDANYCLWNG